MADKKMEKKSSGDSGRPIDIVMAEYVIIAIIILSIIYFLMRWLGIDMLSSSSSTTNSNSVDLLKSGILKVTSYIQVIGAFLSLLFLMGIIYARFKTSQIKRSRKLNEKIKKAEVKKAEKQMTSENRKWKMVLDHVSSQNPSDWRLSVLEADILLAELLTKSGYHGESVGEQLKTANKSDFNTLDEAWEAHKIRNSIAHEGTEFPFSQREAKRVIGLFENVFREFYYI